MKPRIDGARLSSNLNIILHVIPCAALLGVVTSYALVLLTLRPLEMLCGAAIVWRSRGVA